MEVPDRSGATLWPIIMARIHPGTTILHDSARVYMRLDLPARGGFNHGAVNHSINFVNPADRNIHTNTIERRWGLVKGKIRGFVGDQNLDMYLSEYLYREQYMKASTDREKRRQGPNMRTFLNDAARVFPGYNKPEF
jgi:hypothetical protein